MRWYSKNGAGPVIIALSQRSGPHQTRAQRGTFFWGSKNAYENLESALRYVFDE